MIVPRGRYGVVSALAILVVALVAAFLASVALGSVRIPLADVTAALLGGEVSRASWAEIVWQLRLPKALAAVLAGAALATSGLAMQTLFRNPLAGPFVLGINSGASLGVALVLLLVGGGESFVRGFGLSGSSLIAVAAVAGAAVVLALVLAFASRVDDLTLLVLGVLFGYAASALVSVLLRFSVAERVRVYVEWGFGGFGSVTWTQLPILALAISVGLLMTWAAAKPLNALQLGAETAASLGVPVKATRYWLLLATSLLAGSVTAFCGPIGFLGVAVPHLARGLFGADDHRVLIPAAALCGGLLALVADTVAQLPGLDIVLPLNAVTALLGAPVIIAVLLRRPLRSR